MRVDHNGSAKPIGAVQRKAANGFVGQSVVVVTWSDQYCVRLERSPSRDPRPF